LLERRQPLDQKRDDKEMETAPEKDVGEEPQVFAVQRDMAGWRFSRRDFLAAAAAAAASAAAGLASGESTPTTSKRAAPLRTLPVSISMPVVKTAEPGESIVSIWRFTNISDMGRSQKMCLDLTGCNPLKEQALLPVPELGPGETIALEAHGVAPAEPSPCQGTWCLRADEGSDPITSGLFVLQVSCIVESAHPYANNLNVTWNVTNPDPNAQYTRVHFSRVEVEKNFDHLYLKDNLGQIHQTISGNYSTGLWSKRIPGRVVQVQLVTGSSVTGWGFCLDQVETVQSVFLPAIFKAPPPPPCSCHGYCSCNTVCSCVGHCSCNTVCTCNTVTYWYPN
jgi:hypothetical protein